MTQKTRNITGWILTGLLGLLFIGSGVMKMTMGGEEVAKNIAAMGLTLNGIKWIGLLEIAAGILFIFPRTGVLGTLLLAAYMGGAIATHVEHQLPFIAPAIVEAIVWITAAIRFPELTRRLAGKAIV